MPPIDRSRRDLSIGGIRVVGRVGNMVDYDDLCFKFEVGVYEKMVIFRLKFLDRFLDLPDQSDATNR